MRQGLRRFRDYAPSSALLYWLIPLLFALAITEVNADMFGFLKNYDIEMSPEVKGRLTDAGNPVAGVTITRSLRYSDGTERSDQTQTDGQGQFEFPAVTIQSGRPGSMFGVDHINQRLEASTRGQELVLWSSLFSGIKMPQEYKEKLSTLNCDVNDPQASFSFPNHSEPDWKYGASGICRWSEDFEIYMFDADDDDEAFFS